MRKRIVIAFGALLIGFVGYRAFKIVNTKLPSPTETVTFNSDSLDISVTYCRPYKKGRQIFGEAKQRAYVPKGKKWTIGFRILTGLPSTTGALVPNGVYWRLGANEATEISFSRNVNFAGARVNAGKYRMYAVPEATTWEVSLNSQLGQWGYMEPDYTFDVVKVKVPIDIYPQETEQFTITFDNDSSTVIMNFIWDKTMVHVPVSPI